MTAHRSIYDHNGIGLDKLRQYVPSVFAETPYSGMSDRYGFVPTVNVVEGLQSTGFNLVSAGQTLTRNKEKGDFTRHVLRFRPQYAPTIAGQAIPEVVLMNSHDGSSGFKLWLGIFRMVCANGMIVSNGTLGQISVSHRSNAVKAVQDQSVEFLGRIDSLEETIRAYIERQMTEEESFKLAAIGAQIRWGSEMPTGLNSRDLLIPRRYADAHKNLWSVMNTIQENLTKGGIDLHRSGRRSSTRGLRSVNDDTRMNTRLWAAADGFIGDRTIDVEVCET